MADFDLVSRTRTFLFHGMSVSVSEVARCLMSLERLCCRLPQLVFNRKKQDEFHRHLQVSARSFFNLFKFSDERNYDEFENERSRDAYMPGNVIFL